MLFMATHLSTQGLRALSLLPLLNLGGQGQSPGALYFQFSWARPFGKNGERLSLVWDRVIMPSYLETDCCEFSEGKRSGGFCIQTQ